MVHEKIEQIRAENKSFEVDGTSFEVEPLTTKEFLAAQMKGEDDESQALREILYHSVNDTEGMNREDIDAAPAKFTVALQDVVMEVNDFEDFFDEAEIQEARQKLQ